MKTPRSVAKLLADAKNAAGDRAVAAAEAEDYRKVAEWQRIANEIDALLRATITESAVPSRGTKTPPSSSERAPDALYPEECGLPMDTDGGILIVCAMPKGHASPHGLLCRDFAGESGE